MNSLQMILETLDSSLRTAALQFEEAAMMMDRKRLLMRFADSLPMSDTEREVIRQYILFCETAKRSCNDIARNARELADSMTEKLAKPKATVTP